MNFLILILIIIGIFSIVKIVRDNKFLNFVYDKTNLCFKSHEKIWFNSNNQRGSCPICKQKFLIYQYNNTPDVHTVYEYDENAEEFARIQNNLDSYRHDMEVAGIMNSFGSSKAAYESQLRHVESQKEKTSKLYEKSKELKPKLNLLFKR